MVSRIAPRWLLAFLLLALALPCAAAAEEATLYRLVDGDSMWMIVRGLRVEVRLAGVDTPEYNQPGGDEATEFVRQWFARSDGRADLRIRKEQTYDRYNRLVVWIWRGDELLNETLVKTGHAVPICIKPGQEHWERLNRAMR